MRQIYMCIIKLTISFLLISFGWLSAAEPNLGIPAEPDLLDTFLSTGAISQAQHDKSLSCLIEKMGIKEEDQ